MQKMQEMQVRSLGWEVPLEDMATHSIVLAGKIPWTEKVGYNPRDQEELDTIEVTEHML